MGAQILSRKLVRYTSKFNTDKPNSKQLLTPTSRGYNLGYPFLRPFRVVVKSYTYNILVGAHLVENFHNSSVPPPVLYHQSIPKLHSHFLDARFLGWPQLFSCYFYGGWEVTNLEDGLWIKKQKITKMRSTWNFLKAPSRGQTWTPTKNNVAVSVHEHQLQQQPPIVSMSW